MKMKEKLSKMFKNGFLLGMSVMMVAGLMQIQRTYASEENKTVDLIVVAEANEGAFTKLELSAQNPVDSDNKFELEVELAIDNEYLEEKISDLSESDKCGLGTETVDIDCLNALGDVKLEPIMVKFTIDGSNIAVEGEHTEVELKTADNTRIGQYSLTEVSELISCTVIFDKAIYSYMDVTADFSFGLRSTVENTDTQMPQLSFGDEGNTIVVVIAQNPAIPPDSVIDYELEKTGKELTDTVGIEYMIKATAEKNESAPNSAKAMLNGKTLIEEIPDGLMLEEIKRGDTELTEVKSKDFLNGSNYLIEGNQLIYKFAEYSEEEESISDTTFTVKYALNETGYMNFMKNGIDKKFKNTAKLFGDISLPPLAISNTTETPLKMAFMNKDGHAKSLGSKTYDWEIVVNSAFSSGEDVFIVDEIDSSNQIFNKDSLKINEALVSVTEN